MSTPLKLLLSVTVVLVAGAIALTIFIKTQVTQEKVRETLLPLAEKSLDRKVDYQDIRIGLFSGISITGLEIMQQESAGEFIKIKSLELSYKFWPLLTGRIEIDKILLAEPYIAVSRLSDGTLDIADLLPGAAGRRQGGGKTSAGGGKAAVPGMLKLVVNEIRIENGELHFTDKYNNPRSPYRYVVQGMNLNAKRISLEDAFPIDISATINDTNIDISGNYAIADEAGSLLIHLAPMDLIQFAPYFRESLPGKLGSARLALNLELDLHSGIISSRGKVDLDQLDLVLNDFPSTPLQKARVTADYSLNYDLGKKALDISTLLLRFNELRIGLEGGMSFAAKEPFMTLSLLLDQLDLRQVIMSLPDEMTREYRKYSLAGLLDGRVELYGALNGGMNLLKSAQLTLADVQMSAENLRVGVSGVVVYSDKSLQADKLLVNYGDQQAILNLKGELQPSNQLKGQFSLAAKELNLNPFFSSAPSTAQHRQAAIAPPSAATGQPSLPPEPGPFDLPVELRGTVAVDRLIFKQLAVDKVQADLQLKNNVVTVESLTGQIDGGKLKASSMVDLGVKGFAYQGQIGMDIPNIRTLVAGLAPDSGLTTSGQLLWQNSFSGVGTVPKRSLHNLQLKGEISLQQGLIEGVRLLEQVAGFLGSPDLKTLQFKSFAGQYNLKEGLAHLNGKLDSSKTQLIPNGTIDLDGRLNLNLETRLAPEIMAKLGVGDDLKATVADENGWGTLPLQVRGSLKAPKISFNSEGLQQLALRKAREKASRKLLEKILPDSENNKEPIKQLLDNTLNKLLRN